MKRSTGLYKAWLRTEQDWGVIRNDYDTKSTLLFVSSSSLNLQMDKEEDSAILGGSYPSDFVIVNKKVQGSFNFTGHPENLALLYYLHLGKVISSSTAIRGGLGIFYTGVMQSCKITTTNNELKIKAGNEGNENDLITVDLTTHNTIKKVYDYIKNTLNSVILFTYGDINAPSNFGTLNIQIKGANKSSRSGLLNVYHTRGYSHRIGNIIIGEDKQSFSFIQSLGGDNVEAFIGCKAGQLTLEIPNGGLITGTCNVLGKEKLELTPPTSYIKEKTKPIASSYAKIYVNGEYLGYTTLNLDYNPNLFTEIEGGSFFQTEPAHGKKTTFNINVTYYYDDITNTKIKQKFENDDKVEVIVIIESNDYIIDNVKYLQIFRFVKCTITEANIDMGGEVFNLPTKFEVLEPDDNEYRAVEVIVNSSIDNLSS